MWIKLQPLEGGNCDLFDAKKSHTLIEIPREHCLNFLYCYIILLYSGEGKNPKFPISFIFTYKDDGLL